MNYKSNGAIVAIVSLLLLIAAPRCQCQGSKPSANVKGPDAKEIASFAGCYELKMGRWWPWGFGEDNEYVEPPDRIQLLTERGTRGFEEGELLIRTVPRGPEPGPRDRSSSFWQIRSGKRVELEWTDGFVGVTLKLKKRGDGLSGWAHPHFDVWHFIPRIAHSTARRTDCGAPK